MKKLFLIIFGLVLGILLFEGLLRVWDSATEVKDEIFVNDSNKIHQYDSLLGWRLVPDSSGAEKRTEFDSVYNINGQGFRDDKNYAFKKEEGKERVIFLGDSFTFGIGVENGKTIPKLFEKKGNYETLNFGSSGYDVGQYFLILKEIGMKYGPDAVVFDIYLGNDIEDVRLSHPYQWSKPKPYFKEENGEIVLKNSPVPTEGESDYKQPADYRVKNLGFYNKIKWIFDFKAVLLGKNLIKQNFYPVLEKFGLVKSIRDYNENFLIIEGLLKETQTLMNGKKVVVMVIPSKNIKYNYLERQFGGKIEEIAGRLGIDCVNLIPLIVEGENYYYPNEGHFNESGYALAADALYDSFNK
jgi:lysophospholipase L1-like esterase